MKSRSAPTLEAGLHPWVKLTQASLERAKPGTCDALLHPGPNRLNVLVSKEAIPRSMLIWDRVLKAVGASGFKARMEGEYSARTIVTVDGLKLSLRLREKLSRTEHVPTDAEKERMERFKHLHGVPTWDQRPSGKLVFTIDLVNCHDQTVNQVTWTDTDKKPIEDRLDSVSDVLLETAKGLKRRMALWEERERTMRAEERGRQEAARLEAEEKARIAQLEKQASAWAVACSIRQFVLAVRQEAIRRTGAIEAAGPLDQWLQRAERHAASVDPVAAVLAGTNPAEGGG